MDTTHIINPVQAAYVCLTITILWLYHNHTNKSPISDNPSVPNATGGAPVLGNALQYKDDPTGCIRHQETSTGSKIFRMNMAGRKMVIVGSDSNAMKQLASLPESTLSSRRAVAEMGFEYTLGSLNVYEGTDWHKRILKDYTAGNMFHESFLPNIYQALEVAMEGELRKAPDSTSNSTCSGNGTNDNSNQETFVEIPDLFQFLRRCVLRATLDDFVSPLLLQKDPRLLTDLMAFQDKLETAIAKSVILPRFLALPVFLWPVQSIREGLQRRISALLPSIYEQHRQQQQHNKNKDLLGPWLKTYLSEKTSSDVAAEHLIGLIFAAHKNPSIGAAQCLCFLRQELSEDQQQKAANEARTVCAMFEQLQQKKESVSSQSLLEGLLRAKVLRACVLETNRLVAHTLGAVRYANKSLEVTTTTTITTQPTTATATATAALDDQKRQIKINQGETVSFAHHTMHMERSLWGAEAAKFQLDRPEWMQANDGDNVDIGVPVDQYKYTTFSNGVHKCPGERVAMAMMQMILAVLVRKEAQFVGELAPLCFERATLAQRDGPCCIRLKRNIKLTK